MKKIVLVTTALALLVSCGKKQTNKVAPPQKYPMEVMSKQSAAMESVYPATIKGKEDIEIRPRIDGFIKEIYVDEGSVVVKGQKLFLIDSPQADQDLLTAQASVNDAEAKLNTAKLNVDRMRPLAEKKIVSEVQLRTYENAYQSALSTLSQAKAVLTNARAKKSWTQVSSPVNGVVGAIPYRMGSLVNNTNVLTSIANTSNVFAYFSLNEKTLMNLLGRLEGKTQTEKIKKMPAVTLTLADGSVYPEKGKIETITGSFNVATGSANFRAEFPNKDGILRSGSSGKITLPETVDSVFVIPQKATFSQQDKILVYKVQGDSVVQTLISTRTMPDGKNYIVTDGLKQGDTIVTDNIATLKNNMKIKVD